MSRIYPTLRIKLIHALQRVKSDSTQEKEDPVFTKLLYPTDFSESAGKSLAYLKQLRKAGAEEVIILNVIHQRIIDTLETVHKAVYFQDGRYQEDAEEAQHRISTERERKMAPIAAELEAAGFRVRTLTVTGYPVKVILKMEKEEEVSAIVMGSHGRSNFAGARMGSVTEKVARRAVAPVLIIKR